jgi:serine/threonine protein phosphatase PrpC
MTEPMMPGALPEGLRPTKKERDRARRKQVDAGRGASGQGGKWEKQAIDDSKERYNESIQELNRVVEGLGLENGKKEKVLDDMKKYLFELKEQGNILSKAKVEVVVRVYLLKMSDQDLAHKKLESSVGVREIADNRLDQPKILRYQHGELAYGSDEGEGKSRNEDRIVVDTENNFFAVIDGVGGHGFGDVAAQSLAESLLQGDYTEEGLKQSFARAVEMVNNYPDWKKEKELLMKNKKEDEIDMPDACVVACKLEGNKLKVFLAGDTRLVVIAKDGKVRFSTFDQGLGRTVSSTFGHVVEGLSNLKVQEIQLEAGDRVCLMSDGVSDNFSTLSLTNLQLDKNQESALWEYLFADGQWDLLEQKFSGFRAKYETFIEEKIKEIQQLYEAGNQSLAEIVQGRSTGEVFSALSRHLNAKMNGERSLVVSNDLAIGKPDNRSFLMFSYEPEELAVSTGGATAEPSVTPGNTNIESSSQEENLEEIKEVLGEIKSPASEAGSPVSLKEETKESSKENEKVVAEKFEGDKALFDNLLNRLSLQEAHYQSLKSKIEKEILDLEEANYKINDFTAFDLDKKRLDAEPEYLKTYGDYCRTYTLNIQRLRELDSQLKRTKFLYNDYREKREILERNLRGQLSPQRVEQLNELLKLWGEEMEGKIEPVEVKKVMAKSGESVGEAAVERVETKAENMFENKQILRVLFTDKVDKDKSEIKNIAIHAGDGREFATIDTFDERTAAEFSSYEAWQNSLLEKSKQISSYDHEIINKIFRLDFLAQKVDFGSLEDRDLANRLDSWYYHMHQRISSKYGILLPTIKNNIPLYFDKDGVAMIPQQYCQNLLLYNDKQDHTLSEKLSELTNPDELIAFVEVVLLGRVLQDSTINIKQLTAISARLNVLLGKNKFLKNEKWLPLKDSEFIKTNYPGLKIEKGAFHRLPLADLRKYSLSLGESASYGIFEFSLRYHNLDYHSNTDEEITNWKEYAKQEKLARDFVADFIEKFKKAFSGKSSLEDVLVIWEHDLYNEIVPLLSFAKVKNLKEVPAVLAKQAEYLRQGNPDLARFYDNVIQFYQNN